MNETISFTVHFNERELIVDRLRHEAQRCKLTEEQLIKRFICDGLATDDKSPCELGESFEDFLVKNGAIRPKPSDD